MEHGKPLGYIIAWNMANHWLFFFKFISHCPHLKSKFVLLNTPTLVLPLLPGLTFGPSRMSLLAVLDCDALPHFILLMDSSSTQSHLPVNLTFCWQDGDHFYLFLGTGVPITLSTHPKTFGWTNKGWKCPFLNWPQIYLTRRAWGSMDRGKLLV